MAQEECGITTSDLVMMIGEAAVEARQNAKLRAFHEAVQQDLKVRLAERDSRIMELETALSGARERDQDAARRHTSLCGRIEQLEAQLAQVVAERDAARKNAEAPRKRGK